MVREGIERNADIVFIFLETKSSALLPDRFDVNVESNLSPNVEGFLEDLPHAVESFAVVLDLAGLLVRRLVGLAASGAAVASGSDNSVDVDTLRAIEADDERMRCLSTTGGAALCQEFGDLHGDDADVDGELGRMEI